MTRLELKHASVYLYDNDVKIAKILGAGNLSRGIRIALGYTYREAGAEKINTLGEKYDVAQQSEQPDNNHPNR